jgi:hypothetical protein
MGKPDEFADDCGSRLDFAKDLGENLLLAQEAEIQED